jgi:hypothetical protein
MAVKKSIDYTDKIQLLCAKILGDYAAKRERIKGVEKIALFSNAYGKGYLAGVKSIIDDLSIDQRLNVAKTIGDRFMKPVKAAKTKSCRTKK